MLPVYGGPGLADFQRFNRDVYDAIFALLENDALARQFAEGVLSRATPPAQRPKTFRTGSNAFDIDGVGLRSDGSFLYDTSEPGKGNGGHLAGTDLAQDKKAALIEYLKSL